MEQHVLIELTLQLVARGFELSGEIAVAAVARDTGCIDRIEGSLQLIAPIGSNVLPKRERLVAQRICLGLEAGPISIAHPHSAYACRNAHCCGGKSIRQSRGANGVFQM
jgi:hypothetical protein